MNCAQVRQRLAIYCHGDAETSDAAAIAAHLASCADCRAEEARFRQVIRLLDQIPADVERLELPRLYRRLAEQQQRKARRWRRLAVTGVAAAAVGLLGFLLPRFDVRIDPDQIVLRWGKALPTPARGPDITATPVANTADNDFAHVREQVQIISQLLHGQREELSAQQQDLGRLQNRFDDFHRILAEGFRRWRATERDVAALTSMQSPTIPKGELHEQGH